MKYSRFTPYFATPASMLPFLITKMDFFSISVRLLLQCGVGHQTYLFIFVLRLNKKIVSLPREKPTKLFLKNTVPNFLEIIS